MNCLASTRRRPSASTSQTSSPTPAQEEACSRIAKATSVYGVPEGDPATAFTQVLKSTDLYSLEQCSVRPYDRTKLKVLKQGVTPLPLRPRLPTALRPGDTGRRTLNWCTNAKLYVRLRLPCHLLAIYYQL